MLDGRAEPFLPRERTEDAEALAYLLVWMTLRSFTDFLALPRVFDAALLKASERLSLNPPM